MRLLEQSHVRDVVEMEKSPSPVKAYDVELETLISNYKSKRAAIEVDFRELVSAYHGKDRLTHLVHSYPAKLILNIPAFFLNCNTLAPKNGLVYDPFCGTGTVLVEGLSCGKRVAGSDSNPLARLIAKVKTTFINPENLTETLKFIEELVPHSIPHPFAPVVSVDKWFSREAKIELGKIRTAIDLVVCEVQKNFFLICFSQIIRKCSFADPRLSVPVRLKIPPSIDASPLKIFLKLARLNISRIDKMPISCVPEYIGEDARTPLKGKNGRAMLADLVVTSPPYAGAQKYIRATSLSLGWLDMAPEAKLRNLERKNIGREHLCADEIEDYHSLPLNVRSEILRIKSANEMRSHIFGKYMLEMQSAAKSIKESLKIGGHLVLVMGDNEICGRPVKTSQYVKELFASNGFFVLLELRDHIKSRGLMTKRNKTAGIISHEHVFLIRRYK